MRSTLNNRALALSQKTADAYSFDRFRSWNSVARALLGRGYTMREAEAIMRSKWMRWAADNSTARYGKVPARVITEYIDAMRNRWGEKWVRREIAEIVAETPFTAAADFTFTDHIANCSRSCGKDFRLTQETIDDMRKAEPDLTMEEIIGSIDFCLECAEGVHYDAEKAGLK